MSKSYSARWKGTGPAPSAVASSLRPRPVTGALGPPPPAGPGAGAPAATSWGGGCGGPAPRAAPPPPAGRGDPDSGPECRPAGPGPQPQTPKPAPVPQPRQSRLALHPGSPALTFRPRPGRDAAAGVAGARELTDWLGWGCRAAGAMRIALPPLGRSLRGALGGGARPGPRGLCGPCPPPPPQEAVAGAQVTRALPPTRRRRLPASRRRVPRAAAGAELGARSAGGRGARQTLRVDPVTSCKNFGTGNLSPSRSGLNRTGFCGRDLLCRILSQIHLCLNLSLF